MTIEKETTQDEINKLIEAAVVAGYTAIAKALGEKGNNDMLKRVLMTLCYGALTPSGPADLNYSQQNAAVFCAHLQAFIEVNQKKVMTSAGSVQPIDMTIEHEQASLRELKQSAYKAGLTGIIKTLGAHANDDELADVLLSMCYWVLTQGGTADLTYARHNTKSFCADLQVGIEKGQKNIMTIGGSTRPM